MVAGLPNNLRTLAIIQARMNSSRLPGKILMPLPFENGKPVLKWITDGLSKCNIIDKVVIATSNGEENERVIQFGEANDISVYRGSEDDVLSRFWRVLEEEDHEIILRFTGDNPFFDADSLEEAIRFHIKEGNDYTLSKGMPLGMNFEIISRQALLSLRKEILTAQDKEHVTFFFNTNSHFKKSVIPLFPNDDFGKLRLTVDYPSDYAAASLILTILGPEGAAGMTHIKKVVLKYPWIFEINRSNVQKNGFT